MCSSLRQSIPKETGLRSTTFFQEGLEIRSLSTISKRSDQSESGVLSIEGAHLADGRVSDKVETRKRSVNLFRRAEHQTAVGVEGEQYFQTIKAIDGERVR
jgi:hypothetical protein